MKPLHLVPALLLALCTALQALAQAPSARLQELDDRAVVDASGAKIADVYDVVVDTEESRAAYLVVSVGMRVVPIPLPSSELSFTADKVVLNMDRRRLESAPALDMAALGPRFKRGRDLMGGKLFDKAGTATIAEVKDLVISLSDGMIANVVVAFDPKAWEQPGWVALPRASVRPQGVDFVATFNLDDMRPASQAQAEQRRFEAARAKAEAVDRDERATQLMGRKIVDGQGNPLAEIVDLAVDPAAGKVLHVLVTLPNGAPSALALPVRDLKRNGDLIVVPAGAAAFAPAPSTGRRLSEVMKKSLVDHRGKEVGRLRDVVVNLGTGRLHYAVAEFEPSWVAAGHLVTVRMPRDDMKVELNALMGAMIFDQKGWPDLNNPQYIANVDAYLAKQ